MSIPLPPGIKPKAEVPQIEDEIGVEFILDSILAPQHRLDSRITQFILSYVKCRDIRQSAMEAGITVRSAYNLRNKKDIAAAITKIGEVAFSKFGFDAHEVVERVKEVVFFDPIDLLNPDGSYRKLHEMPPEARRNIKKMKVRNEFGEDPNGMKIVTGEILEIEFYDKLNGIDKLSAEKDIFKKTTKVEHDVTSNMKDLLLAAERRALGERDVLEIEGKVEE